MDEIERILDLRAILADQEELTLLVKLQNPFLARTSASMPLKMSQLTDIDSLRQLLAVKVHYLDDVKCGIVDLNYSVSQLQ